MRRTLPASLRSVPRRCSTLRQRCRVAWPPARRGDGAGSGPLARAGIAPPFSTADSSRTRGNGRRHTEPFLRRGVTSGFHTRCAQLAVVALIAAGPLVPQQCLKPKQCLMFVLRCIKGSVLKTVNRCQTVSPLAVPRTTSASNASKKCLTRFSHSQAKITLQS